MSPPCSWFVGVGRVGDHVLTVDDWTMAAAVAGCLGVTWVLNARGIVAWWLIPLIVTFMLGLSLRRASR